MTVLRGLGRRRGAPPAADQSDEARVAEDAAPPGTGAICTRWELALGLGAVAILTLAFFAPVLHGKTLSNIPSVQQLWAPWQKTTSTPSLFIYPQGDQAASQYPSIVLQTRAWRAGSIPFWDPYNLGGIPHFINGAAGVLYPARIVLALTVSPLVNHDLFLIMHVFAAGFFMFLLLKEFRLHVLAALLGATAWMFASWNTIWLELETQLPVIAWLPAALLLIHRGAKTRSWRTSVAAGIPLGLMVLGGQLGLAGFAFAICGAYSAALALAPPGGHLSLQRLDPRRLDLGRLAQPALTLGVGVGLGAVALLPTVLTTRQGGRQGVSYAAFASDHTIAVGNFVHVLERADPTIATFFAGGVFVGFIPFLLAFVGFFRRRDGAALGRWLAVGMFLFAIGAPVVTWLAYHLIPTVSRLFSTGYLLWIFDFGLVVLAALGLDLVLDWAVRITRRVRSRRIDFVRLAPLAAALIGVAAVGGTAVQLIRYAQHVNPPFTPRRGQLLYPVTPAIAAIQRDKQNRDPATPQRLIGFSALLAQDSILFSFEDADGYDSLVPGRIRILWRVVEGDPIDGALKAPTNFSYFITYHPDLARFGLFPRVGVTTVVARPLEAQYIAAHPERIAPLRLAPIYTGGDADVYNILGNPARATVVHEAHVVRTGSEALHRFVDPNFDYRNRIVIEADQGLGPSGQPARRGSGPGTLAKRTGLTTNGTAFTVDTKSPGWLVMADSYDPGWHVTVNGRDAKLLRADYAMRAVAVPAGRSRVALSYRPPGFNAGLAISGITVVGLLSVGLVGLRTWRRKIRPTA